MCKLRKEHFIIRWMASLVVQPALTSWCRFCNVCVSGAGNSTHEPLVLSSKSSAIELAAFSINRLLARPVLQCVAGYKTHQQCQGCYAASVVNMLNSRHPCRDQRYSSNLAKGQADLPRVPLVAVVKENVASSSPSLGLATFF